jgi:hypothetical protein
MSRGEPVRPSILTLLSCAFALALSVGATVVVDASDATPHVKNTACVKPAAHRCPRGRPGRQQPTLGVRCDAVPRSAAK